MATRQWPQDTRRELLHQGAQFSADQSRVVERQLVEGEEIRELGVNLAGVEIVLKMRRRMIEMQKQIEDLLAYVRESGGEVKEDAPREPREALVRSAANQLRSIDLF